MGPPNRSLATVEIVTVPRADQLDNLTGSDAHHTLLRSARAITATMRNLPPHCALELRYVAEVGSGRLRLLVSMWADEGPSQSAARAIDGVLGCLPTQFRVANARPITRVEEHVVVELRRNLRFLEPTYEYVAARHGLNAIPSFSDRAGDGSGWSRFLTTLLEAAPAEVSIVLKPTQLHTDEEQALHDLLGILTLTASEHQDLDLIRRVATFPADPQSAIALEEWRPRMVGLRQPLVFKVAVRAAPSHAVGLATSLAAHLAADASRAPAPMLPVVPTNQDELRLSMVAFEQRECAVWQTHPGWQHPLAPNALWRFEFLVTGEEAAALTLLPVPGALGTPGMDESATADLMPPAPVVLLDGPLLSFGVQAGRLPAVTAVDSLTRHTLVVGASGTGKTTSVHSLLWQLWHNHQLPWLAIEPAKREYRTLSASLEGVRVFTPGRDDLLPLSFNLLHPPPGVRCQAHISALMGAFTLALPLFQPLPLLLEQALEETFARAGWGPSDLAGPRIPTLADLVDSLDTVFARYPYQGEAGDMAIALRLRIESLGRGTTGTVLGGTGALDGLFDRPAVVELAEVHDPHALKLISALLIQRVRAHATMQGPTRRLRHVTVLEEAHRLLTATPDGGPNESGDRTDADSVRALCEAISELRGVGEGFVLSTQFPGQLAEAALANTATRVVHRLERAADREAILADLGLPEASVGIERLGPGTALWRGVESPTARVIEVCPPDGVDTGRYLPDAELLARQITRR